MLRSTIRRPLVWFLAAVMAAAPTRAADYLQIGSQGGANIKFNVGLPRSFNFGVTSSGAATGIDVGIIVVQLKRNAGATQPVLLALYDSLGATGNVLATGSAAAVNFNTSNFNTFAVTLSSTVTLGPGAYSIGMTTAAVDDYFFKASTLTLTNTSGVVISSQNWIQDTNTDGNAGPSLITTQTVSAQYTLGTNALAFGNYRVATGSSLSSTVSLVNSAVATGTDAATFKTQALAASATTAGDVTLTGLPSPSVAVGGTQTLTLQLGRGVTGPNSGTATLSFSSVPGSSNTTGTSAIGSGTISVSGVGYDWANAKVASGTFAFGNVRTGSAAAVQTFGVGNQTVVNATYQDLLDVSGSTSNAAVIATGFSDLQASTNGVTTSNVSLAANTATAGSLASTISLAYTSDANGVVGLTNGTATFVGGSAPTLATTGGVYDYANATYSGTSFAYGYVHRGGAAASGTVAIGNQTVTNSSYQDSLDVSASTGNARVIASGFSGLGASAGGSSRGDLVVSISTGTAGSLDSTLALSLVSNANSVAGLSNGTATVVGSPGAVTTTGTVYTGQSTWNIDGSGQWGTLTSNFGTNWNWAAFDGSPGLDAGFTDTDTATFGNVVTGGTATVTITSATASVRALTFSNGAASYALAGAGGGALTLRGGVTAATLDVTAGAHAIGAPLTLASNVAADIAAGARMLFAGGVSGTGGLVKTGGGVLEIVNTNAYSGATNVDGGVLDVDGWLTDSDVAIAAGALLMGSGTLGGNVVVAGTHSPGNSPEIQTVTGSLTYQAGSTVIWELIADTLAGRGTNYDGIDVASALTFSGSTSLDLVFNLVGSTVDWSDAFWSTDKTGTNGWLVYDGATSLTGFGQLAISGTNWADGGGALLQTVRSGAGFSTFQDGNNIYLNYTIQAVPEPATWAMLMGGAAWLGLRQARRRRRGLGSQSLSKP